MARRSRYSPEVRERTVCLVQEHRPEYLSQWVAIGSIASVFGCTAETLRKGVRQGERDRGQSAGRLCRWANRMSDTVVSH